MAEEVFCWILERPDCLPWFAAHVDQWASLFDWRPSWSDILIRAKWIMLGRGLAATGYLVGQCRANKGTWTTAVRTYRLPTEAEIVAALSEAIEELCTHGPVASVEKS